MARAWFTEEYEPVVAELAELGAGGEGTETERYLRVALLRFLLLHTHDWADDVVARLLGEARAPRRRGRHAGPPDPQGDALSVPGLDDVLAADGWPYASAPPTDPDDPGRFHALFGRDSLITALQVLPERPDVARATLRALARLQGAQDDPVWDEEPGKIVHEVRDTPPDGATRFLGLDWPEGGLRYYGSADATSWFLYVLAATGDGALADELRPAWERAGEWLLGALERGGGLVRWGPRPALGGGLGQQGWRDADTPPNADRRRDPPRGRRRAGPAGRGRRHAGRRRRGPARARRAVRIRRARLRGAGPDGAAGARASAPRRWRSTAPTARCAGRARSSAGCCGRACPSPGAAPSGWREPDVLTGFGLRTLSDRAPAVRRRAPTTAARSGRSTPGSAGAGCARRGTLRRRSASAPACSTRSSASAAASRSSTR